MFVTPTKTKSGLGYADWSFTKLRKECAVRPNVLVSHNPTKKEMIEALKKDDKKNSSSEPVEATDTPEPVKGREVIQRVIVLEEYEEITTPEEVDLKETLADYVTLEEIDKEAQELEELYS